MAQQRNVYAAIASAQRSHRRRKVHPVTPSGGGLVGIVMIALPDGDNDLFT